MNIEFTTELLPQAFQMMVKGMVGIFIVLGIIYLAIVVLHKLFPR